MYWGIIDGSLTIMFGPLFTTAIASLMLLLGAYAKKRSVFLEHFCIPIALVGGAFIAVLRLILHFAFNITLVFDSVLQSFMFLAFFTTIGLNGSISLFISGGAVLVTCVLSCWGIAIIQNFTGVSIANLMGLNPVLGIMAGASSLLGGHGTAIAFGAASEQMGVTGASTVGIACATYGLIASGLVGGPVAKFLITHHKLEIKTSHNHAYEQYSNGMSGHVSPHKFIKMLAVVLCCTALGSWIGEQFNMWIKLHASGSFKNIVLPEYVWAMLFAVIFRNIMDIGNVFKGCADSLKLISGTSLRFAMAFAIMTLQGKELSHIAFPLIMILMTQTAIVALMAIFVFFPLFGNDYDAAVMSAGFCGLGLGATHNAVSCMNTVCDFYGTFSHKAMLVISLSGAVLIDLFLLPFISVCINMLL